MSDPLEEEDDQDDEPPEGRTKNSKSFEAQIKHSKQPWPQLLAAGQECAPTSISTTLGTNIRSASQTPSPA